MTELEKQQAKEIQELKKLLGLIEEDKPKAFSSVDMKYLNSLNLINKNLDEDIFDNWFNNNCKISDDEELFLKELLNKYRKVLKSFNEDTLKIKFIGSILEKVEFTNFDLRINDFYHSPLSFKNDKINLNGYCDFYVASGLDYPDNPYFFIQEYKPSQGGGDPEPQLVAEMICAIELNNWKEIKGCFIVGAIWNFVILEKLDKDKYQYFVSQNFDSTKIIDLKDIYRNLLFVKNEIIGIVKKENK
jgi:hypothetical protein